MGRVVIFSGAGISADSGLSTFRSGTDGLWEGHDLKVVCDDWTWRANYEAVHAFYGMLRAKLADVRPNRAHEIVAGWHRDLNVVNFTQNVDDLFERAGCTDVIHLHGLLTEMVCGACGFVFDIGHREWDVGVESCPAVRGQRRCGCRRLMKPNVVFFRGAAPRYADLRATVGDDRHKRGDLTNADVVVVCGTSAQVIPIDRHLSGKPGYKIWVNPEPPAEDVFDVVVLGRAAEVFDEVDRIVRGRLR
jgi:NAD-dependent deacetylase